MRDMLLTNSVQICIADALLDRSMQKSLWV